MGDYISQSDLGDTDDLVQLTDDDQTGSVVGSQVTLAISKAEGEVNGYAASQYSIPISPVSDLVKSWCVTLAVYHLHLRRKRVPESVMSEVEMVRRQLRDLAAGKLTLDDGAGDATTASDVTCEYNARVLSRTKFAGW